MEGMEVQSAVGEVEPGSCKGNWDPKDPLCSRRSCMNSAECEQSTKQKKSKAEAESKKAQEKEEADSRKELSSEQDPIDHLLAILGKRSDECKTGETDRAKLFQFKKSGKPVMDVFVAKTGKVRLVSAKGVKTLEEISSVQQADLLVKELAG